MSKYLLLDGHNLAFRAHHALPELSSPEGFPTGALHGWIKTLWKLQDTEAPDVMAVFFDREGAADREAVLASYKANRSPMPDPLRLQMPHLSRIAQWCGCPVVERPGVEADDLIASAALHLSHAGHSVVIVSADKDLGQILRPGVTQLLPAPTANPKMGWKKIAHTDIPEKFGVQVDQLVDYLSLIGDASDNIPGIDGVGPKTASKWLVQHGSIEGIIAHADKLQPSRFSAVLPQSVELLERNRSLIRLNTSHCIQELSAIPKDILQMVAFMESLDMKQTARQALERVGLFG